MLVNMLLTAKVGAGNGRGGSRCPGEVLLPMECQNVCTVSFSMRLCARVRIRRLAGCEFTLNVHWAME